MAKSFLSVLSLIIGAAVFFPVSCTTALVVGTHVLSRLDARDIAWGDEPHLLFFVGVSMADSSKPPTIVSLSKIEAFRQSNPGCSFLLPAPSGIISIDQHTSARYVITESSFDEQIIEVRYSDHDKEGFSKYKATRHSIDPLNSRLWHHGYMFSAMPYAFVFASLVLLLGRFMRKRCAAGNCSHGSS